MCFQRLLVLPGDSGEGEEAHWAKLATAAAVAVAAVFIRGRLEKEYLHFPVDIEVEFPPHRIHYFDQELPLPLQHVLQLIHALLK